MEKNKAAALGVIVVVVVSLGVIAFWNPAPVPDVRIGYLSKDLHQLALRVAIENGLFAREGINVKLEEYGNGGYEMDGFLAGEIDMGYLGVAPTMVKRINQDILVTILATANLEGSAIMILKSEYDAGHIVNITDLTGKGVMHPGLPTVQNFLLRLALNQSGLSYSDIIPSESPPSLMEASLSVDVPAFIAWEPFNAKAEYDGEAVPLIQSGEIWSRHPCCVVASSNSFLSAHPEIVQKVIAIHVEAEQWISNHPEEAVAIAVDWLGMDEVPVNTAFNNIIFDYNLNITAIARYLDFLIHENQLITEKIPENTSAFLDSFVNATFINSL